MKPIEPCEKDTLYGCWARLSNDIEVLWGKLLCSIEIHNWTEFGFAGDKTFIICKRPHCYKGKWVRGRIWKCLVSRRN
jgi:hypothetical protein